MNHDGVIETPTPTSVTTDTTTTISPRLDGDGTRRATVAPSPEKHDSWQGDVVLEWILPLRLRGFPRRRWGFTTEIEQPHEWIILPVSQKLHTLLLSDFSTNRIVTPWNDTESIVNALRYVRITNGLSHEIDEWIGELTTILYATNWSR